MSNESNNIRYLQRYIIRNLVEFFSREKETLTSRYVLYFDSFENVISFENELVTFASNADDVNELRNRIGEPNMQLSLMEPFQIYNEEGGVEHEATQIKVANGNAERTIVFIPDCDKNFALLGDAFKNEIRNQFVDNHNDKILFYLSVQNIASVYKTTENFQKSGMPLSVDSVYNNLMSRLSIIPGENQQKVVLYALNKIMSNKPKSDTSLLEFAPIIRIIETQILVASDFHDLHMFSMSLTDLGKDSRLADNYKIYRDISFALADQELESVMSKYEPTIIKEIQKAYDNDEVDWDKSITFEHLLKYKKVNQNKFKVEQPILLLDNEDNEVSHDYYLDFAKGSTASFIVFSKDFPKEKKFKIGIRFTQKTIAESNEFVVEQTNSRGTSHKIILDKDEFNYRGKVVFNGGKGSAFTVFVSVINTSASFLADSCVGFTEKKSEYIYQLVAQDYQVEMGGDGKKIERLVDVAIDKAPIPVNSENHTLIKFKYPDGEASKEHGFVINVDDNSTLINVSVRFEQSRLRRLKAYELFNRCYVNRESFFLDEEVIINKHKHSEKFTTDEVDVAGKKYEIINLFDVERKMVDNDYGCVKVSGLRDIEEVKCSFPASIVSKYKEICKFFREKNTSPSLCAMNQEIEELYHNYISEVLMYIGKDSSYFQDKQPITNEILSIFKVGMVFDADGLIWLSPLSPLSVAYQLLLNSGNNKLIELDDYLHSSLGFGNIMPFILDDNGRIYQSVKGDYPIQWACYCDAAQSVKGEENTYSQKIEDYYTKFSYLFNGISNSTFMINVIGIYHTSEIINALLKLFKPENNINNKTFSVEINYYYQGTGKNDFDNMAQNDYVYSQAANYYGAKKTELIEGFCEWYSEHVAYYAHLDNGEYKYAHITFCAMQDDKQNVLENTISDAKSGVMLEGLISDVPSCLDLNSGIYKYGFGAQYLKNVLDNSKYLQLAYAYNELAKCKEGSPASRNSSIAQGVQNTKSEKLEKIYKSSNWVVFVEPKIDLDFFIEQSNKEDSDLIIIHYPDKNVTSSGYTSITVTQKSEQYIEVIHEYLEEHLSMYQEDMDIKRVIRNFNAYSGEWLMNFINNKQIEEKISLVSAISFCRKYFEMIYPEYQWVPVALDEVLRVTGSIGGTLTNVLFSKKVLIRRGIIENQNATSDDLLMAGIKYVDRKVSVIYIPIEVKHGKVAADTRRDAHSQVCNTAYLLRKSFLDADDETKGRIDKKIYRNYMMQHVISNIEKMIAYQIANSSDDFKALISSEIRINLLNDLYELEIGEQTDLYALYFVEGQDNVKRVQNSQDKVIELSLPNSSMYEYLVDEEKVDEGVKSIVGTAFESDSTIYDILLPEEDNEEEEYVEGDKESESLENELSELQDMYVANNKESIVEMESVNVSIPVKEKGKIQLSDVRVLIGKDSANNNIYWEFGNKNLANRHLLITGTSGQGKTYSIQTMLYELIKKGVPSVIFDYTEGFMKTQLEEPFVDQIGNCIDERIIYSVGVPINPFLRHEIDIAGTIVKEKAADVASRLADIFAHVYDFGDQQYSAIFTAALNGINAYGDNMNMKHFQAELEEVQETNKAAKTVISKMEPFFHTISFEGSDSFDWGKVLYGEEASINIFQLTLINREMQVIVTEMMLWDAWYYTKKYGTKDKPFVVILDESQNLSHKSNSPSAAILTEGRKFGWSAWFATQSLKVLKDEEVVRLSQAAFKLFFKPTDDEILRISKQLDPTGEYNWTASVKNLKKGQCIVSGDRLRQDGIFGGTLPTVVSVSSLESRMN